MKKALFREKIFGAIEVEVDYTDLGDDNDDIEITYNCIDITDELEADAPDVYNELLELARSKAEYVTGDEDSDD